MDDSQQIGGNIELVGFRDLDGGSMIILKKIIGNYARKFSDRLDGIDKLSISMKKIGNNQFELHGQLIKAGEQHTSEVTDYNLFMVLDKVLKKLESSFFK